MRCVWQWIWGVTPFFWWWFQRFFRFSHQNLGFHDPILTPIFLMANLQPPTTVVFSEVALKKHIFRKRSEDWMPLCPNLKLSELQGNHSFIPPPDRWWQLKYFWNFHPENWGRWTQFDEHIFQMGWKKPPTSHLIQGGQMSHLCWNVGRSEATASIGAVVRWSTTFLAW